MQKTITRNALLLSTLLATGQALQAQEDKYQWLEEVDGKNALDFVGALSNKTVEKLSSQPYYQSIYDKSLAIYNSDEKIAYPNIQGKYVYNFWKDKDHERGIWRRCLLQNYTSGKVVWETLLDIDALSAKDNTKWVYKGSSGLYPQYNRFLISLSKGGGDAVVIREFDVETKQFVENGFNVAESKGGASYLDENTVCISSDFGEGTMTTSGYPRQTKLWKRGSLLKDAPIIFEGEKTDVGDWGGVMRDGNKAYVMVERAMTFFTSQKMVWMGGKMVTLDLPEDAVTKGILKNQLIVHLKSNWTVGANTYATGTLLSLNFTDLLANKKTIAVVETPDASGSISESIATTRNYLMVNLLKDVTSHLYAYNFENGRWKREAVNSPKLGTIYIVTSSEQTDAYFFNFENFITPSSLYIADAQKNTTQVVKRLPAYFDAEKYMVQQFKAPSKDGTLIPYFVVSAKNMVYNGSNPTLLEAYGGYEVSYEPYYLSSTGSVWLDKGGVCVIANIRGGGEYGPKWHQAGMKEKRQNVFDDLYAVSENLIAKKITSARHLGVMGGSNGGLLVGVAFTQRPNLYQAVVCAVPLLDMQRFNKLLAGASWMGEYGNPDVPEEWDYIKKYSPYHNLVAGASYPEVFFTTSTRDDRVHPGHARKMVAKMNDMGYGTYYYENTEGGHGGSSTNAQKAKENALIYSYLLMKLK
ncbi:MAG: S9 family peptidase [Bacteroidetes bacterium]|nr:MAG: S9 family peptidase [Bacteroidota bacterium]